MPKIKKTNDRQLKPEPGERAYFFPKADGGPVTIVASSREEAAKKLPTKKTE